MRDTRTNTRKSRTILGAELNFVRYDRGRCNQVLDVLERTSIGRYYQQFFFSIISYLSKLINFSCTTFKGFHELIKYIRALKKATKKREHSKVHKTLNFFHFYCFKKWIFDKPKKGRKIFQYNSQ